MLFYVWELSRVYREIIQESRRLIGFVGALGDPCWWGPRFGIQAGVRWGMGSILGELCWAVKTVCWFNPHLLKPRLHCMNKDHAKEWVSACLFHRDFSYFKYWGFIKSMHKHRTPGRPRQGGLKKSRKWWVILTPRWSVGFHSWSWWIFVMCSTINHNSADILTSGSS